MGITEELTKAVGTAFFDAEIESMEGLRPELVYNDTHQGKTVLACLEAELNRCDRFWFSVAFVTQSGLIVLKDTLQELEKKGIQGRILTTNYLEFNQPKALRDLLKFSNIEVKIYTEEDFHTKGYMFENEDVRTFFVGSSNLSQGALKKNKEWNLRVTSLENGTLIHSMDDEFEKMWCKAEFLTEEWIDNYEVYYQQNRQVNYKQKSVRLKSYKLQPNKMQQEALKALENLRKEGKDKGLLISATGTGKTYLSAFDVRNFAPKKMLFLVHREQILKQAIESFKDVLGDRINVGLLSGNSHEMDAEYLFSTVQTMSKEEILHQFGPDYFDYIIIDETHKAGAESYRRILSYFSPKFLLGMTASPERTDGYDIFQLFDHNIAYEIRLQQALEEDLLCPFHYFGITELQVNGEVIGDNTEFRYLMSEERVNNIIEKAEFYGSSGNRVKGLIFCSSNQEALELSKKFNCRGYETIALSGSNSQEEREEAVARLEQESLEERLDYIFTVDIFNEGIDIPQVNQVIMLRPTQSAIIFVQQLGRGLRKAVDKEYVVIIDFIGNYQKNFLIPIALSGDRSYNKDTIRRYVREGSRIIPGSSTIHFDEISKSRIYESIDNARTNDIKLLKDSYLNLKYKLGRIPSLNEFKEYGAIDVTKIFDKCGSYYAFLVKYEKEYTTRLSKDEESVIEFLSKKMISYKRIHELALLKHLLQQETRMLAYFKAVMQQEYAINVSAEVENSVVRNLTNEFPKEEEKEKYAKCIFIQRDKNGAYRLAKDFQKMLSNHIFKDMVMELIHFGIARYFESYADSYKDTNFQLYQKYTYEDVCRLLNWQKNMNAQNIGGYFYDADTKTLPVFINYEKEKEAIAYEDRFISEDKLIALSKHPRKLNSSDVTHIYKRGEADKDNRIFLFVRKNKEDKEAKEFYFLGEIFAEGEPNPIYMESTNDNAFEILYRLDVPVRNDIYDYIVNE